jgi:hypothetical protein
MLTRLVLFVEVPMRALNLMGESDLKGFFLSLSLDCTSKVRTVF